MAWQLHDILDSNDIPAIIEEVRERTNSIAAKKELFTPHIKEEEFITIIRESEQLSRAMSKLGSYASNLFSVNTKDQEAQALKTKLRSLGVEMEEKLLFVNQEWKRFDDENANRLIAACPEFAHHLRMIREGRKHMLSDEAENIISLKDVNGASALNTIYSMITSNFTYEYRGQELRQAEILELIRNEDPKVRFDAYEALLGRYVEHKDVLGTIYHHVIDDWQREAKLRKYEQSISVRNKANEIPDAAVQALLNVCRKNTPLFHTYFKKKGDIIGRPITRYDIYAPIDKPEKISYEDACAKILETFREFNETFADAAKKIIDEEHIDYEIRPAKRSGAYCNSPAPDVTPFILMSFTNTPDSMRTLAHELGHGVHAVLSSHQNNFNYDAALPVCETASIFSEVLLNNKMKKERPDLARSITLSQIDDFYATIIRQSWFVIFEQEAHKKMNESPSVDEMAKLYGSLLQEQFGSIEIPEKFTYEWVFVPHIYHSPFYCYSYSFGCLLSLAFYAQYKKDPAFAQTIIEFLTKGGSQSPFELVKATGFDISDEAFWQSGFDVIKEMIDSL